MKAWIVGMLGFVALAPLAHAQTVTCSVAQPCVALTWQNASMAATVALNPAGVETAGPGYATLWRCTGTTAQCQASGFGTGTWQALGAANAATAGSVAQTTTAGAFTDNSVAYNATYNYVVTNTWTGGGTSVPSAIFQLAIGAPPVSAPGAPAAPAGVVVTSGSYTNPAP